MQNPPQKNQTPIEILQATISFVALMDNGRRFKNLGPGKMIERLSGESREILKQLTSQDTQNQYVPWWALHDKEYENQKHLSELKKKFDKQCSKYTSF